MAKYIDAEKLKELINEKWKELADKNVKIGGGKWDAEISTYLSVLGLIGSLQQEQPDFPTTDEQIKEFLATHPKVEVPEKYKNPDWLFKKQEQQEADLEKEINKWLDGPTTDLRTMARHFFELGKNSK